MDLDFFKAEHAAMLDLRQQMLALLNGEANDGRCELIVALRRKMDRLLTAHLAKEGRYVYPRLSQSADTAKAGLATQFSAEADNFRFQWTSMIDDWPNQRIATDPSGFETDMRMVLDCLARRIDSEEADLYPACLTSGEEQPEDPRTFLMS